MNTLINTCSTSQRISMKKNSLRAGIRQATSSSIQSGRRGIEWPSKREVAPRVESRRGSDRFMFPYGPDISRRRRRSSTISAGGLCLFCLNMSKSPNIWSYPADSCKYVECRPCVAEYPLCDAASSIRFFPVVLRVQSAAVPVDLRETKRSQKQRSAELDIRMSNVRTFR